MEQSLIHSIYFYKQQSLRKEQKKDAPLHLLKILQCMPIILLGQVRWTDEQFA